MEENNDSSHLDVKFLMGWLKVLWRTEKNLRTSEYTFESETQVEWE